LEEPVVTASGGEKPAGSPRLEADQILGIYDRWQHDLRRFLLATCGDAELAEELLQATFSRLVERGQTARPESIRGWLFKVAHNELRLWRRRSATHARWLGSGPAGPAAPAVPWEEAIRGEEAAAVRRALADLPPEQRQVVEARIQHGQTFAAIAAELGLPLGTVLTRMRLALAKLRRSLAEGA
jgi:RNA polymerase sigma factor (sigma-70 family)